MGDFVPHRAPQTSHRPRKCSCGNFFQNFRVSNVFCLSSVLFAGGLLPLRPASNSFESFSNVVDKDWIQFHLYFPESIQPDPVQVIDDSSGLVAAYW